MGKFPSSVLKKYVFTRTGTRRDDVLVWPGEGIDVAVTSLDQDFVMVSHCDPIVGALHKIGWLAVHIACNDVATSGIEPRWILPTILLPEEWSEGMLNEITRDIDLAAKELDVAVIGGHTGYGAGLLRPIVVITAIGVGKRDNFIISSNAKENDTVFITKGAGIEGTAILATDFKDVLLEKGVESETIEKAKRLMNEISVVREALALAKKGVVHAMHDATRGGVAEALIELAVASRKTIEVWVDRIPVCKETEIFAKALRFDPLWMISSGTLVFTVPNNQKEVVKDILSNLRIIFAEIGNVKKGESKVIIHKKNKDEEITSTMPERDELARMWEMYPRVKK